MKKVLIIDDDRDIRDILRRRADQKSFECLTAESAEEGLAKADETHPDLILLDLMMPDMSGFGFLRELKKKQELSDIPVVVLKGVDDADVVQESKDLGAVGYLTKDCDQRDLLSLVAQYT